MDQFDKNIQEKLSRGPDRKPDPDVWRQVVEGLGNRDSGGGVKSWGRWLSTGALIVLLCSLAYLLGQKNSVKDTQFRLQLDQMSQAIAELKATIRDTIYLKDTLWPWTAAKQLTVSSLMSGGSSLRSLSGQGSDEERTRWTLAFQNNFPLFANSPFTATSLAPWSRTALLGKKPSQKPSYGNERSSFDTSSLPGEPGSSIQNIAIKSITPQFHFKRVINLHPYRALNPEEIIKLGRRRKIWATILPDRHRIALVSGALNTVTHELEHTSEWLISLQYEMLFSARFSVLTGLRYRNFAAKSEHDLEDINYPIPPGLIAGDQLDEIYIDNHYLSIPLMAKYSLPLSSNFRSYLRAGLLFTKVMALNYQFEIDRQDDELKLHSKIGKGPMILSSYLMGVGVEYSISSRFSSSFDLEGRYQFRQSNIEFQKNHGLGIRLGFHYTL